MSEKALQLCACGCPHRKDDKVVIMNDVVHCNQCCADKPRPQTRNWRSIGRYYDQRDAIIGGGI